MTAVAFLQEGNRSNAASLMDGIGACKRVRIKATWATALIMTVVLSGCVGDDEAGNNGEMTSITLEEALADGITTPQERELLDFRVDDARSHTLMEGAYPIEDARSIFVDVELPMSEGGQALNPVDGPKVHLGLFLPTIPGCDWDADTLADECQIPVIADVGPYYSSPEDEFQDVCPEGICLFGEGDVPATERGSGRLGEFLISRFVPHGYAVAQVSVFGSGQSNHCFDVFGYGEQLGVHGAVEYLGSQSWSNGNVGLIGRSYDGSTPWMAAQFGSEHLKTIVPISGLSGLGDLVTWNGASESRVATFQNVIYGRFGLDSNEAAQDAGNQATCPDWTTATAWGGASYASGDDVVQAEGAFWAERHFLPDTIANYDGSVYMIHGLVDNNVDPHAGWIGELAMRENGNDVRAMWGQWGHMYPDRVSEHGIGTDSQGNPVPRAPYDSIRMDWAQDLLEWFNFYLKGEGSQPPLHTEVQQLDGGWRVEPVWPPADAEFKDLPLGSEGTEPINVNSELQSNIIAFGALSDTEDVLLGGYSTVSMTVTPTGEGGQIYVELRDGTDGHDFGLSYGIMELRHATGEFAPVAPGVPMEIEIPFQIFDAVLPAGHELELYIDGDGNDYLPSPVQNPVQVDLSNSVLHLSTLERGEDSYYMPPVWWDETEDEDGNVEITQKGQGDEE